MRSMSRVGDLVGEPDHREGLAAGDEEQGEEADDHQRRPEQRVEEELDRRVLPVRAAPDADHEVHREQDELEEDEEEDQVLGDEGPEHPGVEHQGQDEEGLRVVGLGEVVPAVDDHHGCDQQRERDERQREPVEADDVVRADDLDPRLVDDALELARVVVVELGEHPDADAGGGERGRQGQHLVHLLFGLRDEHHEHRPREGEEHHEAQAEVIDDGVAVHGLLVSLSMIR